MRFTAFMLAVALTAAPGAAQAQAISPAQAVGIAQAVLGIVVGPMFGTPQCGPHDAMPPPYQPARPNYNPPPPPAQQANLDDQDDEELRPLPPPRHSASDYSLQPQNQSPAEDETGQPAQLGASDQSRYDQSDDESQQPVTTPARHRAARRNPPPSSIEQTQSSGQVTEIPSLPRRSEKPQQ